MSIERDGSDPLGISLANLGTVTAGTLQNPERSLVIDLKQGIMTMADNRSRWRIWFDDWFGRITRWFWPPDDVDPWDDECDRLEDDE